MPELADDLLDAWLTPASSGDPTRAGAVREGAAALAESSASDVVDMVLLAHAVEQPAPAERLRASISAHDPTFEGRADHLQTQIAAAWTLAQTLQLNSDAAVTAALAICSARFCDLVAQGPELYAMAVETLRERQISARRRPALARAKGHKSVVGEELAAAPGISGAQIKAVADALSKQITTLAGVQNGMADAVEQHLTAAEEEINALWWTIGGRREGDGPTWGELGCAAGILAGRDLATMTSFSTPPPWADGLLARALVGIKDCTLEAAISALDGRLAPGDAATSPLLPITSGAAGHPLPFGIGARLFPASALARQTLIEGLLERRL